ncbi:MAG: site-specific DNA-methyltransferase [Nitratireductor sp.]
MTKKTKLELTWPGKEERPKLEPRILIEDPDKSYRAEGPGGAQGAGSFDNILIKGDNLLALKALEAEYAGKVKCIYIDPPFNTGSAFEHYDDGLEHTVWLKMLHERLLIFRTLLADDGAIAVQLDDTESAYCKIMMDEIFGRKNYITTVTVEAATTSSFKTINTGPTQVSNFIFLYAKDKEHFEYGVPYLGSSEVDLAHFSRFIENFEDKATDWRFVGINAHILEQLGYSGRTVNAQWAAAKKDLGTEEAQETVRELANEFAIANAYRVFETKTLQKPSKWLRDHIAASRDSDEVITLEREGLEPIYLLKGRQIYFLGKGLREVDGEQAIARPVSNIWTDIPTNNLQSEGGVSFPSGKKPEFLVRRILQMLTQSQGDLVLDSFAGSGTTGAVAQKMGRRWIMIEIGNHAETHIIPRLENVISGEDQAGISKAVEWQGGGGFRYYTLAPSLLEKDKWGNWVVAKEYNPDMLAAAMCKHLGFTYAPSENEVEWWRHGQSSETDFLYVTTQSLTRDALKLLSDEVGEGRSLMICAPAFSGSFDDFENLSCTKIPTAILSRCEWGRDDYSLNVNDPVPADDEEPVEEGEDA